MRRVGVAALLLVAACSDGGADGAAKQKAAAEAAKALQLTPGQWETMAEVTKLTQQDKAAKPALNTPAGTKNVASACILPGDVKSPPLALLAGSEAYKCSSENMYMSRGTINTQLTCTRTGLAGEVRMSVDGTYTADTITANQELTTYLPGDGDAAITSTLTSRRIGDCPAEGVKKG